MDRRANTARKGTEQTRRRIVEATVALHEEVGHAATTIKAIAERAGVQRLTVYRHFPSDRELFGACSAHWSAQHPFPDAAEWAGLEDAVERLRVALTALYAYYRDGEPMLKHVYRDEEEVPALAEVMAPVHAHLRELAGSLATGWGVRGDAQRRLRAAVGHAVQFETWRSLAGQGLSSEEAAGLMTRFVSGLAADEH